MAWEVNLRGPRSLTHGGPPDENRHEQEHSRILQRHSRSGIDLGKPESIGGREFNIVEDDCAGCFLYVLENEECTGSFLFDAQDQAKACALEKFGVPIAAWIVR